MASGRTPLWAVVALLVAGSTSAEGRTAYRCVHPDGRVEYTAMAVQGMDCQELPAWFIGGGSAQPPVTAPTDTPATDADDPRRSNCEAARYNLEILQGEAPVARTDEAGNPLPLSAEQRAAALEQARKDVDYWCD